MAGCSLFLHRQPTRDEEADRPKKVRRPHPQVLLANGEGCIQRLERGHVEEQRAEQLYRGCPPTQAAWLDPEPLVDDVLTSTGRAGRLDVLQVASAGKEQRADEIDRGDDLRGYDLRQRWHRTDRKTCRSDHEENSDPPTDFARRPQDGMGPPRCAITWPGKPASAARTVPLPVPTGGEFDNLAVGAAHQFANDEWPPCLRADPDPAGRQLPRRGRLHPGLLPAVDADEQHPLS